MNRAARYRASKSRVNTTPSAKVESVRVKRWRERADRRAEAAAQADAERSVKRSGKLVLGAPLDD